MVLMLSWYGKARSASLIDCGSTGSELHLPISQVGTNYLIRDIPER